MIYNKISINVDYDAMGVKPSPTEVTLTSYILDSQNIELSIWKKRPAVIVCPGGGYGNVSCREAEPIALSYLAAGMHSFVLNYSVAPSSYPAALCELSKAVAYVKEIADDNNIDKDNIYVIGFSAGGHLAASLGVHADREEVLKFAGISKGDNHPKGIILGYPVITAEEGYAHMGSINNFTGENEDVRPLAYLERYVTDRTPEMFIFHTFTDGLVPVQNSLRFASALAENKVKCELHIYPDGSHGLSLSNEVTATVPEAVVAPVQGWVAESIRWIKDRI